MNNLLKQFVERSVVDILLGKKNEAKYGDIWIVYASFDGPVFWTSKEPCHVNGIRKSYDLAYYMGLHNDKWLPALVEDITKDLTADAGDDETDLEKAVIEMRDTKIDFGEPKYRKD